MSVLQALRLVPLLRFAFLSLIVVYHADASPYEEPGRFIPDPDAKPLQPMATADLNAAKKEAEKTKPAKSPECVNCGRNEGSVVSGNKSAAKAGAAAKGLEKGYLDLAQRAQFQAAMWDLNRSVKQIANDVRRGKIAPAAVPQIQTQLAQTFRAEAGKPTPVGNTPPVALGLQPQYGARYARGAVSQVVPPPPQTSAPVAERELSNVAGTYSGLEDKTNEEKATSPKPPASSNADSKLVKTESSPQPVQLLNLAPPAISIGGAQPVSHPVLIYSTSQKENEGKGKKSKSNSPASDRDPASGVEETAPSENLQNAQQPVEEIDLDEEDPTLAGFPEKQREPQSEDGPMSPLQSTGSQGWWKPIRISRGTHANGSDWMLHPILLLLILASAFLVGMFSRPRHSASHQSLWTRNGGRKVPSEDPTEEDDTKPEIRLN